MAQQHNGDPHGHNNDEDEYLATGPRVTDYDEDLEETFHGPGLDGTYDGEEEYMEGYDDDYWGQGQENQEPNGEAREGAEIPSSPVGVPMPLRGSSAPMGPPPDQLGVVLGNNP